MGPGDTKVTEIEPVTVEQLKLETRNANRIIVVLLVLLFLLIVGAVVLICHIDEMDHSVPNPPQYAEGRGTL